jgi:pimeloyl-ACP methyl ester carboxylesterase
VQALVLVAPVGGPGGVNALDRVLAAPILGPALTWLGFRGLGALLSYRRLGTLLIVRRMGIDPAALSEVLERLQHGTVWRSFLTEQRALLRCWPGLLKLLPAITTPAAVLAGTRDCLVRPSTALAFHQALNGSSLHWAPGGHLIPAHPPPPWPSLCSRSFDADDTSGEGEGIVVVRTAARDGLLGLAIRMFDILTRCVARPVRKR